MRLLLDGLQTTPFETRELEKISEEMVQITETAEGNKALLWKEHTKTMEKYRKEHETLSSSIRRGENLIAGRLQELREARVKAQTRIRRQFNDEVAPHNAKLIRMENDTVQSLAFLAGENRQVSHTTGGVWSSANAPTSFLQRYVIEKAKIRGIRDQKAFMNAAENAVLEDCVRLKVSSQVFHLCCAACSAGKCFQNISSLVSKGTFGERDFDIVSVHTFYWRRSWLVVAGPK